MNDLIAQIDAHRAQRGFLSVSQLLAIHSQNILLDPLSILISEGVELGTGNVLYPGVILEIQNAGRIRIGNRNFFYPGALFLADQGEILAGDENEFGDGGVRIKAIMPDSSIIIGNAGRYMSGPDITGRCVLGSGTQILGAISVQNCTLGAGESYRHPDPDQRGGLFKGAGLARNLTVGQGEVISQRGMFEASAIERQSVYHPPKA